MFSGMRLPGEHCVENRADAADQMIARLSDLLRMTLENSGAQEVTLQQELDFLEQYVEIEHTRFRAYAFPGTAHRAPRHRRGSPRRARSQLSSAATGRKRDSARDRAALGTGSHRRRRAAGEWRSRPAIQDNGRGFPAGASTAMLEGLGLGNTRARLEQLYGTAHRLDLSNAPEGGAVVHLSFPFNTIARVDWEFPLLESLAMWNLTLIEV